MLRSPPIPHPIGLVMPIRKLAPAYFQQLGKTVQLLKIPQRHNYAV
jgi:hypothetical protein